MDTDKIADQIAALNKRNQKFFIALTVLVVVTLLGVVAVITIVLMLENVMSEKVISIVQGNTLQNIASSLSEGITRGIRANVANPSNQAVQ